MLENKKMLLKVENVGISVNGKSQNPAIYIKIGRNLLSRTSLKSFAKAYRGKVWLDI